MKPIRKKPQPTDSPDLFTNPDKPDRAASMSRIGTDESGKGDYFGPLVTAAVWVPPEQESGLLRLGVRDSKKITDKRATALAAEIKAQARHAIVVVGPEKYNQLYEKIGNLNRLLAWTHARAIENILETVHCDTVIADKFGDEKYIISALMKKGRAVRLVQLVRAESDLAVAAASIVARAEFLRRLDLLSRSIRVKLHKGASPAVDQIGRHLVADQGVDVLKKVAKWHFKNTKKILGA